MGRVLILILSLFFIRCGYDSFDDNSSNISPAPIPNISIATLRALYSGKPIPIKGNPVIFSGYITTSDRANNFYRTFIVEDESGAIEIKVGLLNIYNSYPLGQKLVVVANGLSLGEGNGLLQLGNGVPSPTNGYTTDYINIRGLIDRYVVRVDEYIEPKPKVVTIGQLTTKMTGKLVTIDNLTLDYAADTTWAISSSLSFNGVPRAAAIKFKVTPKDSIYVNTSGYANFAAQKVPRNKISVTGILMSTTTSNRTLYQLKLRDEKDIQSN